MHDARDGAFILKKVIRINIQTMTPMGVRKDENIGRLN